MSQTTETRDLTINDFVDELVITLVNTRIYWSEHPRVNESIAELRRLLPELCSQFARDTIELFVTDNQLVFDERPLLGASLSAPPLIHAIVDRGAGGIAFDAGATDAEFAALVDLLTSRKDSVPPGYDGAVQHLARAGCRHLRLLPEFEAVEVNDDGLALRSDLPVALYQGIVEILQDTTISLCHGGLIQFERSQACMEQVLRSLQTDPGGLLSAVRYERYDAYTFGHSIRVCILALNFARTLTSDETLLNRIGVAALLHDVGKAKVPFEVLHCRTRLSAEQRREMEKHPTHGAQILLDHHDSDPMAYGAAFGHHIGANGAGYPRLLRHADVSLVTRIVKICDVYEALTAERPYKPSMTPTRAFRIMVDMGEAFDRALLKRFILANGTYPAGSQVLLSTGEHARVLHQSHDLTRPVVEIQTDNHGEPIEVVQRRLIDLSCQSEACGCVVEKLLRNADLVNQD